MTRAHEDPRLTAYALGELDAEEQQRLEAAFADDTAARVEVGEIRRMAALIERELSGATGLGLSAGQKLQLERAWQERSDAGDAGAHSQARTQSEGRLASEVLFDDFASSAMNRSARRRFGNSVLVAMVLYGTAGAAIIAVTATARKVIEEEMIRVDFAPPPAPEPPPPPVPAAAPPSIRPKVKRAQLAPPIEVPKDKLAESDKALASAPESGPVDGFLNGVEGGTGTRVAPPPPPPPPPAPGPLVPPRELGGADSYHIKYSSMARRKGIEGKVVVLFVVLEDGSVANVKCLSGAQELCECVLRGTALWRFKPAHRDGRPVRYSMRRTVIFRLQDA